MATGRKLLRRYEQNSTSKCLSHGLNVDFNSAHTRSHRVKLPKTFLAVNLSDAFTFQEKERQNSEADVFDKDHQDDEHEGLEMRGTERSKSPIIV